MMQAITDLTRPGVLVALVLLAGAVQGCGGSPTPDADPVQEALTGTPAETAPVPREPTPEELAAEAAAAGQQRWTRAMTLIEESLPGERAYGEIERLLGAVSEQRPGDPNVWFNLGLLRQEQGDLPGAVALYQRATDADSGYARGLANISYIQLLQGETTQAAETIRTCLARKQSEPGCNINLSLLYRQGMLAPEGAVSDPQQAAIQRLRYSLLDRVEADAYTVMAEIYQMLGQDDLARLVCENAVQQGVASAQLWNRFGLVLLAEQDVLRAYAAFREATQLDAQYWDAFLNLGSMAFQFRDYPTAADAFNHVLGGRDEDDIRVSFGAALRGLELYAEARAEYDRVLGRTPEHPGALYNYAILLQEGLQDYGAACGYYKRYLAHPTASGNPQHADATRRLNSLASLTRDLAAFGELDPEVAAACDPSAP
jgi:tetratricopeptide (TPR) repeat protein